MILKDVERRILFRIIRHGRICESGRHISLEDLLKGMRSHQIGEYKDAVEDLCQKGYLGKMKKQDRMDYCIYKDMMEEVIPILQEDEKYARFFAVKIL
ncbi:hypothetical protein FP804_00400 [archaeon]|nr:hypothetical protein [archaeon]